MAPEERQLIAALETLALEPRLPEIAEVEPGALLHLVKIAGRKAGRDGRRRHLTDEQVAKSITALRGSGFSRNQYQAMFGEGRVLGQVKNYKQGIPQDIAEAYMRVALNHWRKIEDSDSFYPLFDPGSIDLDQVIENAIDAMYDRVPGKPDSAARLEVYCRAAPGPSIQQFYKEAGEAGQSIIVLARKQPITMSDPATQIPEWMRLMEFLLDTAPARTSHALHVWAFEEPLVSDHPEDVKVLTRLARLQAVLTVARSIFVAQDKREFWNVIDERCPMAILRRDRPDAKSGAKNAFIDPGQIFPEKPPLGWKARGIQEAGITSLVAIARTGRVTYSSYEQMPLYPIPPVLELSSPAAAADQAFRNLHLACLGAMGLANFGEAGDVSAAQAVTLAKEEGWSFIRPSGFVGQSFPLKEFE